MMAPDPRLAVLLATYRGADWLVPQLDSIGAQTRVPDLILASDDASDDDTCAVLDGWAAAHAGIAMTRLDGPGQGAAANFLSLIARAPADIDRLAFADQDDVWLPGKLERACDALDAAGEETPVLYCTRILICDADLGTRRPSPVWPRPPSFANALAQNIATGSTIVLNRAATDLVRRAGARVGAAQVPAHDWWMYQIVTGAGGRIIWDAEPQVLYRQHGGNLMGDNAGLAARLHRVTQLLSGTYADWTDRNIAALVAARDLLTPQAAATLDDLARARRGGPLRRVAALRRLDLHRQGRVGQAALYMAAALGRF